MFPLSKKNTDEVKVGEAKEKKRLASYVFPFISIRVKQVKLRARLMVTPADSGKQRQIT